LTTRGSGSEMTLSHATGVWEQLAGRVGEFVRAWEAAGEATGQSTEETLCGPPRLVDFLPGGDGPFRRMALIELIKIDLDYRWKRNLDPQKIEDYARQYPDLSAGGFPCDLIYEEFHVRRLAGDTVRIDEYTARFPQQSHELRQLLGLENSERSTVMLQLPVGDDIDVGRTLDDFDLLTRLGKGAFATVFLARQRSLGRLVALKVSTERSAEPQTLAQMDHEHIVRVYDQRILKDRNLRLLYMQYIPGGALQDVVRHVRETPPGERSGKLLYQVIDKVLDSRGLAPSYDSRQRHQLASSSWPEVVCWIGARLGEALHYATGQGVLHRDVKPANVLLTAEGSPKLVDFNVSCSSKVEGASPAAFFGGSLAYMSPEQLEACHPTNPRPPESLDARSDLFSLGVMLWELITGERPFGEEMLSRDWLDTLDELMKKRQEGISQQARALWPASAPRGLLPILERCLAANPDERPRDGADLARQLALCLQPRARDLLWPPPHSWLARVRRLWPAAGLLFLAIMVPNILAAIFNFKYNFQEIILALNQQNMEAAFMTVQAYVNGIEFPLGAAIAIKVISDVLRPWSRLLRGEKLPVEDVLLVRRRALRVGHLAAGISFSLWLVAGIAFPLGLHYVAQWFPPERYFHFFMSMLLCGLVAASYPFLAVMTIVMRVIYPVLMWSHPLQGDEAKQLDNLGRWSWFYLVIAACVPMLAVLLLVMLGPQSLSDHDSFARLALGILGGVGLLGFLLAFTMVRSLHQDLQALIRTAPAENRDDLLRSHL